MVLAQSQHVAQGIPPWVVYVTIPAVGFALASLGLFVIRQWKIDSDGWNRFKDIVIAVIAALAAPGAGAAGAALINIRSVDITVSEAAVLSLFGAAIVWICVIVGVPVLLCCTVFVPLAVRYSPRCAGQAIRHVFIHRDPRASLAEFWARFDADESWDEFADALGSGIQAFRPAEVGARLLRGMARQAGGDPAMRAELRSVAESHLSQALERPLGKFSAVTGKSKFRFSIWRVDDSGRYLERVFIVPDRDDRTPIPLWKNDLPGTPASHAAEVLHKNESDVMRVADKRTKEYPVGRLGSDYISIRGVPLICNGDETPWGVLYVDKCHGTIPLDSDAMKLLCRTIARAVEPYGEFLKHQTIGETHR